MNLSSLLSEGQVPSHEIFRYMSSEDIINFCQVNRDINDACNRPETWISLMREELDIDVRKAYLILRGIYELPSNKFLNMSKLIRVLPKKSNDEVWVMIVLRTRSNRIDYTLKCKPQDIPQEMMKINKHNDWDLSKVKLVNGRYVLDEISGEFIIFDTVKPNDREKLDVHIIPTPEVMRYFNIQ